MRLGLIINGRSRRNRAGGAEAQRAVAEGRIPLVVLDGVGELPAAVRQFADSGVDVLAVSGGDGTVQAVLTEVANSRAFAVTPALAVLAGGTTNMIAADVGLRGRPDKALTRLLRADSGGTGGATSVTRNLIRLDFQPGEPPIYGMFFGAAAICRAILFCRDTAEAAGLTAGPASAVTLGGLLFRNLFRGGRDDIVRGDPMTVRFDGAAPDEGERLLVLATTLDRLVMRSRPYWGGGTQPIRYSEVRHPPRKLVRAVAPFLLGRGDRLPNGDYRSRTADRITLRMDCPFTLDGELYEPLPGVPVELSDGGAMRFLRC